MPGVASLVVLGVDLAGYIAILGLLAHAWRRMPRTIIPVRQKWSATPGQVHRDLWLAAHWLISTVLIVGVGWTGSGVSGDRLARAEVVMPVIMVIGLVAVVAFAIRDELRLLRRNGLVAGDR